MPENFLYAQRTGEAFNHFLNTRACLKKHWGIYLGNQAGIVGVSKRYKHKEMKNIVFKDCVTSKNCVFLFFVFFLFYVFLHCTMLIADL